MTQASITPCKTGGSSARMDSPMAASGWLVAPLFMKWASQASASTDQPMVHIRKLVFAEAVHHGVLGIVVRDAEGAYAIRLMEREKSVLRQLL